MTRRAQGLLASVMLAGLSGAGAWVFSALSATATPFGGSDSSTCGTGLTCSSDTFTSTTSSGDGFSCSAQLGACFDVGGACGQIGRDNNGYIQIGDGCSPVVDIGETTRIQPGQAIFTNGGLFLDGTTYISNQSGAVKVTDTDGLVINSTSAITGISLADVVVDIASIAANSCDDVTATVAGVEANDFVSVIPASTLSVTDVTVGDAHVTNAGTDEVTFRACNSSGGAEDPDSATFRFLVVRKA